MTEEKPQLKIGEMRKRRERMADGRRYLIYYTFETDDKVIENNLAAAERTETEKPENV